MATDNINRVVGTHALPCFKRESQSNKIILKKVIIVTLTACLLLTGFLTAFFLDVCTDCTLFWLWRLFAFNATAVILNIFLTVAIPTCPLTLNVILARGLLAVAIILSTFLPQNFWLLVPCALNLASIYVLVIFYY